MVANLRMQAAGAREPFDGMAAMCGAGAGLGGGSAEVSANQTCRALQLLQYKSMLLHN